MGELRSLHNLHDLSDRDNDKDRYRGIEAVDWKHGCQESDGRSASVLHSDGNVTATLAAYILCSLNRPTARPPSAPFP